MTDQEGLQSALYRHCLERYDEVPSEIRYHFHWEMSLGWRDELRKMGVNPIYGYPGGTHLLGLPMVVTSDGGVPQLVA